MIFYNAIGLSIERLTGVMVTPMMKMSHEGFGRQVLLAGRLVVVNKQLRDVHRFGFNIMEVAKKTYDAHAALTEARKALSSLIERYFASLYVKNVNNMKWKKFFYKQLCDRADIIMCPTRNCLSCIDYKNCFSPEEMVPAVLKDAVSDSVMDSRGCVPLIAEIN